MMPSRPGSPSVALAAAALTLGVLTGCGHAAEEPPSSALPAAAVRVQTVASSAHTATEQVAGTVRAKVRAVLEAKVSGKIERMAAVPGQAVRKGQLLVSIEAREVQARLEQALAVRQQADGDLKRYASLLEQDILSRSDFDAAQSRFRVADAAVREAETLLGYTSVVAPFDGVVTRKHADVGDLAAPGRPLLELEDVRTLRFEADVPEAMVAGLTMGDRLSVRVPALPDPLPGTVSEIAPAADPGSRTFLVKLDLPQEPLLRAGQFGRVAVPMGESAALRVPASAVLVRGQMEIVFVVVEGRARLRIVRTGERLLDQVELVSGVEGGETIVVEGAPALLDGQPIRIR